MRPLGQCQIQNPPPRMRHNPAPIRMPLRQRQIANVNHPHPTIIHNQPKKSASKNPVAEIETIFETHKKHRA
jgi:hypothetical protein